MRKLMVGLLFLLLVAPVSSSSVGFGEVDLQSFLNQPLRAEIPLRGAVAVADSLRVRQAPEDAYRRVGLNRGGVPGDLDIEVEDDRVILTTRRPVREPYVGILLEARWDGGRAMREISLLLDPPGTMPSGAPALTPAEEDAPPRPREAETVRVGSGDTLYSVVRRSGISGYSDAQVMLAFLDANPDAFIDNNINALRADTELRMPTRAELEARGEAEARDEVGEQTRAWQASVRAAREEPEPAPEDAEVGAEDEVAVAPDTVAREEEEAVVVDEPAPEVAAEAEVMTEDRLEIVVDLLPDDVAADEDRVRSEELLQEALLSQRAEMEGMREQISELREELGERSQLADLSSEYMAELEAQLSQLRSEREQLRTRLDRADAERHAPLHERIMNDPLLLMMAIALVILLLLVLLAFARGGRREIMVDEHATGLKPRADNSKVQASESVTAGYEARYMAEGRRNPTPSAAAGATAGGVAGTAAASTGEEAGGQPQPEETEAVAGPDEQAEGGGEAVVAGTGPEGHDGADDVLAEVDVCLAYGMNDQAVETLNAAIAGSPENKQYRLRLVEAYLALEDEDNARQAASGLRDLLDEGDSDIRDQLAGLESRMGAAGGDGDVAGAEDEPAGERSEVSDAGAASGSVSNEIDFAELELPETDRGVDAEAPAVSTEDDGQGLAFDIDENLESDLAKAAEAGDAAGDASADNLDDLAFDLDETVLPDGDDDRDLPEASPDRDDVGLDLDENLIEGESGEGAEDTSEDENVTRLSLAQAYADMGDQEGAEELVEEVLASGTEEQKREAEAIREQLKGL
ncbi:FimV/HubP family polar landmark protein [Thioalkalivibrio sp. ALJT]|uniref:FimV/HubP family polar landmark protein n=1 Tax=Thioalkalivibrio sp. ALJT TaxID=1158146 RepID=UPI000476C95C|nr:FimV/HubP family polar landmark protein [Thioalkalivibrio sp. ALJT]